jgi:hypothetical protein
MLWMDDGFPEPSTIEVSRHEAVDMSEDEAMKLLSMFHEKGDITTNSGNPPPAALNTGVVLSRKPEITKARPMGSTPRAWTAKEDKLLIAAIEKFGDSTGRHKKWEAVSQVIGTRNGTQCQQRWSQVMRPGLQKGLWSAQEDGLLLTLVGKFGTKWPTITEHWSTASAAAGRANRTSKQIRERWSNKLDPSLSREPWSTEEDKLVFDLHTQLGNSWSCIAKHLPGRVPDSVKTRFKTLNRRAQKAQRIAKISQKLMKQIAASTPAGSNQPSEMIFQLNNNAERSPRGRTCTTLRSHGTVNVTKEQKLSQDHCSGFMLGGDINSGGGGNFSEPSMTQEDGLLSGIYHDRWGVYTLTHSSASHVRLVEMAETPMWQPAEGTLIGNLLSVHFSNARNCGGMIRGVVAAEGAEITWSNGARWIKGSKPTDEFKANDNIHDRTRYWLMHGGPDGSFDYNQITRVTLGPPRLQKRSCS